MNRKELVQKLELVGRALATTNMVPIFECFCFSGSNVFAYNDQLGLIAPCPTDEAFAVNGKTMLGLLTNSQSEEVQFQLGEELEVKAGKSRFKLPYQTKEEFLFKEPEDAWHKDQLEAGALIPAVEGCLATSSKDLAQPALMGVWLKNGSAYSCDGDALTKYNLGWGSKSEVMLPNAFCETIVKLAQEHECPGAAFQHNKGWAKASFGQGYIVYGRLIENDHPLDHEDLITKTVKGRVLSYTQVPEDLDHALSRARIVADPESKPTQLTVEGGKLTLLTDTHLGVVRDVLPFKHPDVAALVSPELMQRSIKVCTEMSILENCCCFRSDELFCLLSNYG